MLKLEKSIVSILYTAIKFALIKILRFKGFYYKGIQRFSPNTMVNIWKHGKLELGKSIRAHTGTRLSVTDNARLKIGDNTVFNYNCIIVAKKKIEIGHDCTFGPGVIIYDHDHDHDFRNTSKMNSNLFISEDISIGNNVWIGANSIILKGSPIGDNCVIAAGTVLRGRIESNTIVYNEKNYVRNRISF